MADTEALGAMIGRRLGERVVTIEPTGFGRGATYVVVTPSGRRVAKLGVPAQVVLLARRAETALAAANLTVARIVYVDGELTVSEWVGGDTYASLTSTQAVAAWRYARRYLAALRAVPAGPEDIPRLSAWDDAHSLAYLVDELPASVSEALPVTAAARQVLDAGRQVLQALPRQLVHTDLGPDNFVFDGDKVRTVLDFTPAWASEGYALAHFVYWNVLWPLGTADGTDMWRPPGDQFDIETWRLLLIHAALSRVVGPTLHSEPVTPRRPAILAALLNNLHR